MTNPTSPPAGPQTAAKITVRRNSPDDVQFREVIVKLDGVQMAELLYGNSVTFPVAPGHHRLRVDNTWNWKTLELDVTPGDDLRYLVVNRAGRFTWFLIGTLGAGPIYVSIQKDA